MQDENDVEASPETLEAARQALTGLAESLSKPTGGVCFKCKRPYERKEQVGRCIYFRPCGHSYQGWLPKQGK